MKHIYKLLTSILLAGSVHVPLLALAESEHDHTAHPHSHAQPASTSDYPLTTCVVSGEELEEGFKSIQYKGREVRFCCNDCKKDFYKDPERYMKKFKSGNDDAYPLSTCVISGEDLGSMGEPYVFNYEGTEVRFCCKGCKKNFLKNPEENLAKIDAAKAKAGASKKAEHHGHEGHQH